ncbi:MAG: asparagine synthase (glutamine-hydrolyzing) [Alphaproteobacteria bacterium]
MCGIAGFSFQKSNPKKSKEFLSIKKYLDHRGPDNSDFYRDNFISLVHTRLSIVDLDGGNQPIINKKKVLVANGEIYNDQKIRKEYSDFNFNTNSDCESILALYESHGIDGFSKLSGMYSFAIFDREREEIILCRDIFGIKPLYYSVSEEGIMFCSEIKPFILMKKNKGEINNFKFNEFMQLQYCSGSKTIFEGINRVLPGQIIIIKKGKIIRSFSNKLPKKIKHHNKLEHEYIDKCLSESVSNHLRSDVPYCIFFSGGIDSMLLAHYVKKLNKKNITAFSIKFTQDDYISDSEKIIKKFDFDLVKEEFKEEDFWNWILFAAYHIDEPIADYAVLPTFKLASVASKKFKVALTGEGGDELFGGYGRYKKNQRFLFKRKNLIPRGAFHKLFKYKFSNWDFYLKNNYNSHYVKNSKLTDFQIFDYKNWLPNDLLVKLDRCLMTYGMEGRTPFIDKTLFQKLFYTNNKNKINKGFAKYYIREFLSKEIPEYESFKKKRGFTVPIYDWIPNKIDQLERLLLKVNFLKQYFSTKEIQFICDNVRINKKFAKPLWHIIFFTSWYFVNIKKIDKKGNFFDVISRYI